MNEPFFFDRSSSLTVGEIATLTGAEPAPGARLDHRITSVASLDLAGPHDVTFFDSLKFSDDLSATGAGVCLMDTRYLDRAPHGLSVLKAAKPYQAFVEVARKLFPASLRPSSLFSASGIANGANVHELARLEQGVSVDPGAVIGPHAEIGSGSLIGANAVIGPGVRVGRDCAIGAGCTITNALIGDRVVIHPGCLIGQDGFGYVGSRAGHKKVPQIGRVIIQDDVEIGAGTTIDRGGIRDTFLGEGTKIDNLVQIGHNASIGRHCIIVSLTGVSGSVTLEDYVVLGGQVGIVDHLTIGEGAQVASQSGIMSNIPAGERWGGYPAQRLKGWMREVAALRKLSRQSRGGKTEGPDE
jgi:UDP-3-O-[3-hydroxymyristoyl] glucosamine N-acyltransferase